MLNIRIVFALILCAFTITHTHDWINHIQSSLSYDQIQRDVQSMHRTSMSVQETIENALRDDHTQILTLMKREMQVPDDVWQQAIASIEHDKQELLAVLYSKENIHDFSWFITEEKLNDMQSPQEHALWNNLRIVTKNTLLDYGINPKNIYIYANDAWLLDYLDDLIKEEPSWWNRQKLKLIKGFRSWGYAFSPIWCMCPPRDKDNKPKAKIGFNMSSMAYFEPTEQHGLLSHEITHLLEGHIFEQDMLVELEKKYGKIQDTTWRSYFHNHELIADQLPALKGIMYADKCSDAIFAMGIHWPVSTLCLTPMLNYFLPKLSTHPSTIFRSRALSNIVQYLEYEQQFENNKSEKTITTYS